MENHSVMEETGKKNKLIMSSDSTFLNTECIFMEYYDLLKSPWFTLLDVLRFNEAANMIFDFDSLKDMDLNSLFEWYATRSHRNMLRDVPLREGMEEKLFSNDSMKLITWMDNFLETEMMKPIIENSAFLNFHNVFNNLLSTGRFVKKIVVYTDTYNESIESDLLSMYGKDVHYMNGNLEEVLKEIPQDTTYVLSDISKIYTIMNENKLDYSSILIADEYHYNYSEGKPKVDFETLLRDHLFKIDFFDNIHELG